MIKAIEVYGVVAMDVADALGKLGHLMTADAGREDSTPKNPGVALILRRAAWRLEHGTLDGWADEEEARRMRPRAESAHGNDGHATPPDYVTRSGTEVWLKPAQDASEKQLETYYDALACLMCDDRGWLRHVHVWEECPACRNPTKLNSPG